MWCWYGFLCNNNAKTILFLWLIFAVESPTVTVPNKHYVLNYCSARTATYSFITNLMENTFKKTYNGAEGHGVASAKCGSAECTCSFWNGNDTSRNKRRIKNTILDGFFTLWMMYLLVFIHLGHNIRFSPARCVKSLLPTPQLSLLPLQWEKWRQYQRKCRCLSEITRNSIAQCISHTVAIVLSETFIILKKIFFTVCQYKLCALV